jgi:hypothetical protein
MSLEQVRSLLHTALRQLDSATGTTGLDRPAWRIADAGLLLREFCESRGITGMGIDEPTGRGATLPNQQGDDQ